MTLRINAENKKTPSRLVQSLAIRGIGTGLSIFATSNLLDVLIRKPNNFERELLRIADKTGSLGLKFSGLSALVLGGASIYEMLK